MQMLEIWVIESPFVPNYTKVMDGMYSFSRIGGKIQILLGTRLMVFSYGKSSGSPSEKGLKIDAETALQYVFKREELRNSPIILYGQSLGGAVAIYLAEKHQDEVLPFPQRRMEVDFAD